MNARLVVVEGAKPATVRLRLPIVIGRSSDAKVKVPSSQVSRKHCEIYCSGNQLVVRDLDSANGTYVNGVRIEQPTLLSENELLRVGEVTVRVLLDAPAEAACATQAARPEDSIPTAEAVSPAEAIPMAEPLAAGQDVTVQPVETSPGASSVLSYQETTQGSFVGIEGLQEAGPLAGSSAIEAFANAAEEEPRTIDAGDSALDDFFKKMHNKQR